MDHAKLDPTEADVLNKVLDRVVTHAPPPGININVFYDAWVDPSGRDYIDALYRPRPLETLLSDDLILRRQWFLVSLPHVVTADDLAQIIARAGSTGHLDGFEIHQNPGFLGISRRQPTRLARFVADWLAPQLAEAPIACTAEFLLARAAIQESRRGIGVWPPAFIQPEQRPAIEVELALLAQTTKAFDRVQAKGGPMVFRSAALAASVQGAAAQPSPASKSSDKGTAEKLAAAEKKIAKLNAEILRLETLNANMDEAVLQERFKRLYREHVQNYHPDKLSGRPEAERRLGEEVTRVLNALYQDIKV